MSLFVWSLIILIPLLWPLLKKAEPILLPVVTDFKVEKLVIVEEGTLIWVSLNKIRNCQYLGMEWYRGNRRIVFDTERKDSDHSAKSRIVGEHIIGPWFLEDTFGLDGVTGYVQHSCHPLWTTRTKLYPPKSQEE